MPAALHLHVVHSANTGKYMEEKHKQKLANSPICKVEVITVLSKKLCFKDWKQKPSLTHTSLELYQRCDQHQT